MASRVRRRSSRSFLRYAPNRLLPFSSTVSSPRLEVTSTVSLTGYRRTFSCNRSDRTADYIPPGHTRVKEACFKFETAGARTPGETRTSQALSPILSAEPEAFATTKPLLTGDHDNLPQSDEPEFGPGGGARGQDGPQRFQIGGQLRPVASDKERQTGGGGEVCLVIGDHDRAVRITVEQVGDPLDEQA